jgi:hypothetical protein
MTPSVHQESLGHRDEMFELAQFHGVLRSVGRCSLSRREL